MRPDRAWVLLPSRRRLNLLAPDPQAWTDRDLAIGLSRTYPMGRLLGLGPSALRRATQPHRPGALPAGRRTRTLTAAEARRELLHDATEGLLGGYDPITPIKPHLGEGYRNLVTLHQAAVDTRYALPPWDDRSYRAAQAGRPSRRGKRRPARGRLVAP